MYINDSHMICMQLCDPVWIGRWLINISPAFKVNSSNFCSSTVGLGPKTSHMHQRKAIEEMTISVFPMVQWLWSLEPFFFIYTTGQQAERVHDEVLLCLETPASVEAPHPTFRISIHSAYSCAAFAPSSMIYAPSVLHNHGTCFQTFFAVVCGTHGSFQQDPCPSDLDL